MASARIRVALETVVPVYRRQSECSSSERQYINPDDVRAAQLSNYIDKN